MDVAATLLGVVVGIVTSIVGAAISYGFHKAKIESLQEAIKTCVDHELMVAMISPIKEDIHELKTDIKDIVRRFCSS